MKKYLNKQSFLVLFMIVFFVSLCTVCSAYPYQQTATPVAAAIKISPEYANQLNVLVSDQEKATLALRAAQMQLQVINSQIDTAVVKALVKAGQDPEKKTVKPDGKGGYDVVDIPPQTR
jgi:hypothetical protein